MRKLLIAAVAAGLLAVVAPAFADVAGTGEGTDNNVNCDNSATAQRQNVPQTGIWVAANGSQTAPQNGGALVLCNEGGGPAPSPIQGRIIASGNTSGGYVAADGDRDNAAQAQGWARADVSAAGPKVRCGGPADAGSGTNAETPNGGSQAYCG